MLRRANVAQPSGVEGERKIQVLKLRYEMLIWLVFNRRGIEAAMAAAAARADVLRGGSRIHGVEVV